MEDAELPILCLFCLSNHSQLLW